MSTRSFITPGSHTWTLPANIDVNTPITVTLKGAGGGGLAGGKGSLLIGTYDISVLTPGVDALTFLVGGRGGIASGSTKGAGGTNGGGAGGNSSNGQSGSGGGGWTGFKQGTVVKAVAAGGGGMSAFSGHGGGDGGAATGQAGDGSSGTGGHGGTSSAGGAGGTSLSPVTNDGLAGSSLAGGHGNNGSLAGMYAGGGGGGGKFGGGGGGGSVNPGFPGGGAGGSDDTSGLASVITHTRGGGAAARANGSVLISFNAVPNGPAMDDGRDFDANLTYPIGFVFSDPDVDDTMSALDVRWSSGAGWNETDGITLGADLVDEGDGAFRYAFPAATFTGVLDITVEIQFRTYDQHGAQGDWSASIFATPHDTPATPNIDYPLNSNSDTINSHSLTVTADYQNPTTAIQIQVVDDAAGSPGSTVYIDTGVVPIVYPAFTEEDYQLPDFAYVNGDSYHVLLRYQYQGIWSGWADSGAVLADINPPLAPSLTLTPDLSHANVLCEISNPGSDPFPPVHNDLYRTDVLTGDEVRIATGVPINGSYTDWTPGFRRDYSYIARAVTATGAFASST